MLHSYTLFDICFNFDHRSADSRWAVGVTLAQCARELIEVLPLKKELANTETAPTIGMVSKLRKDKSEVTNTETASTLPRSQYHNPFLHQFHRDLKLCGIEWFC